MTADQQNAELVLEVDQKTVDADQAIVEPVKLEAAASEQ